MIKLVVCDLDGTLLRSNQTIANETIAYIKKIQDNGIRFLIATGRHHDLARAVTDYYNIDCDMINNNGAEIVMSSGVNYSFPMDNALVYQAGKILFEHGYHTSFHTNVGKFTFLELEEYYRQHVYIAETRRGYKIDNMLNTPLFNKELFIKNCKTITLDDVMKWEEKGVEVFKIDGRNIDDGELASNGLELIKNIGLLSVSSSYEGFVEINSIETNKGNALELYIELLNIDKSEVVVFGDNANDLEMLRDFPNSYAMANASESCKEVAANVAMETNNNDGVYLELKKMFG